jgi:hypothetical protein
VLYLRVPHQLQSPWYKLRSRRVITEELDNLYAHNIHSNRSFRAVKLLLFTFRSLTCSHSRGWVQTWYILVSGSLRLSRTASPATKQQGIVRRKRNQDQHNEFHIPLVNYNQTEKVSFDRHFVTLRCAKVPLKFPTFSSTYKIES